MRPAEERFHAAAQLAGLTDAVIAHANEKLNFGLPSDIAEDMERNFAKRTVWLVASLFTCPELFPLLDTALDALATEQPVYRPFYDQAKAAYEAL